MTDHEPLPVAGYTAQSQSKVDLANEGKELEERVLRWIDKVGNAIPTGTVLDGAGADSPIAHLVLGKRSIQQGFMWSIRAIFRPQRIKLPGDEP